MFIISEILIGGSDLAVTVTFTATGAGSSVGIPIASSSSFSSSIEGLFTTQCRSKPTERYSILLKWIDSTIFFMRKH